MTTVTIGADPEVFFASDDGTPKSAIGLIGGSKWKPVPMGNGFFVLEDNVAAEYNIPPTSDVDVFVSNIQQGLKHVESYALKANRILSKLASASFSPDELNTPEAKEFGCMPDFNAWSYDTNETPHAEDSNFRSCGGHIHVGGITNVKGLDPIQVIRAMDLFLGVPSVVLDPDKDRRKLYGKAGAFRDKEYGVEYRTLSNFWVFEDSLIRWVYDATIRAVNFAKDNIIEADSTIGLLIQHTINESDKEGYDNLVIEFPSIAIHP